jgi:hypothetical protein
VLPLVLVCVGFPIAPASVFLPLEAATASFSSLSAFAFSAAFSADSGPSIVARKSSSVKEAINMVDDDEYDEEEEDPAVNAAAEFAAREPAAPSPDDKDEALLKMATPPSLAERCAQRDSPRAEGGRSEAGNTDDDEDEDDEDEDEDDEDDEGAADEAADAEGRLRDGTTVLALVPAAAGIVVDGFFIDCDCDSSFTAVELNGSSSSTLSPPLLPLFDSPPDAIRAMTGGLDLAPTVEAADDDAENDDAGATVAVAAPALEAEPEAVAVAAVEPAAAAPVFLSPPDLAA